MMGARNPQGIILHEYHYWFFAVALKPEQEAAAELTAFPFFPVSYSIASVYSTAAHRPAKALSSCQ
jgi:hypothetical protein